MDGLLNFYQDFRQFVSKKSVACTLRFKIEKQASIENALCDSLFARVCRGEKVVKGLLIEVIGLDEPRQFNPHLCMDPSNRQSALAMLRRIQIRIEQHEQVPSLLLTQMGEFLSSETVEDLRGLRGLMQRCVKICNEPMNDWFCCFGKPS